MRAGDFLAQQTKAILASKQQAVLFAIILALLPFTAWLSVALMALVTLRKGPQQGFEVMFPAALLHMLPFLLFVSVPSAIVSSLVTYLPCYLAAVSLHRKASWQNVCAWFLLQACVAALIVQCFIPGFIGQQFAVLQTIMADYPGYKQWISGGAARLETSYWPQLFFGFQMIGLGFSALLSLLCARAMQAKLFNPGGFKQEALAFRSARPALLVLITTTIAGYYGIPLALNILPLVLGYFLVSGFGLVYCVMAGKRQISVFVLLLILLLLKPSLVLLIYVICGSLDSVFNFRIYLSERVSKST